MKSKFLYLDVDVVFLAYKSVYDKFLMETVKLCDNIRVPTRGLC